MQDRGVYAVWAVGIVPKWHGGSKFIVQPMTATLIKDGVAMGFQFIKNRRLIVWERYPQPKLPNEYESSEEVPGHLSIQGMRKLRRNIRKHWAKLVKQKSRGIIKKEIRQSGGCRHEKRDE